MHIGEVIDGKYVVERKLGQGGMGTVVAARHQLLGTPVAIKLLTSDSPEHARRFMREARNASKLRGPHMTQVLHVGRHREQPYMVLEYVEGVDLGTMLDQGKLAPHLACGYVVQACEGLAEAHALGMVHRDVKPSNLMLTHSGVVKLLDFGIATAATGDHDMLLTSRNDVLGSPHYMSPEQLRSTHDVDARTDVWSLGVTLYELISGRQPFEGRTFAAITIAVVTEPHEPLFEASVELSAIVDRCLAKSAAERFQSVGELAAALAPFAQDRSLGLPAYLAAKPQRPLTDVLSSFTGATRISPADHQRAIVPQPAPWVPPVRVFPQALATPDVRPQCALAVAWADDPIRLPPSAYPAAQPLAWHPESELDGTEHTSIEVELTSMNDAAVSQLELVDGTGDRVLVPPAARGSTTQIHAAPPAGVQLRPPSQPGQSYVDADAWSMSCTGDDVGISNLAWNDLDWDDARGGKVTWSGTADARATHDLVRPSVRPTVRPAVPPSGPPSVRPAASTATLVETAFSAISSDPDPTRPVEAALSTRPTVEQHTPSPVLHAQTMPLGESPRLGRLITGDVALAEPEHASRPTPADWAGATPAPPQLRYARRASAHPIVAPLAARPARPPVASVQPSRRPPLPPLARAPRATPNPDTTANPTIILTQSVDPVLLARLAPTSPVPAQPAPPPDDAAAKRAPDDNHVAARPIESKSGHEATLLEQPPVVAAKTRAASDPAERPLAAKASAQRRAPSDPADVVAAAPGKARARSIVDGDVTPRPTSFSQRTYLHQSLVPPAEITAARRPEIRAPQSSLALPVIPAMSARLVEAAPPPPARTRTADLVAASLSLSTAPRARTIGIAAAIATVAVLAIVWFATRADEIGPEATAAVAAPVQRATATVATAPVRTPAPPAPSAVHETAHVRTPHVPLPARSPAARRASRPTKSAVVPCRPQDPSCGL